MSTYICERLRRLYALNMRPNRRFIEQWDSVAEHIELSSYSVLDMMNSETYTNYYSNKVMI